MRNVSLRPMIVPVFGALLCLAAMPHPRAGRASPILEQLVARAVGVSAAGEDGRIDIYIERWSDNGELDALRGTLGAGTPNKLLPALQALHRRAGVVLMPGIQGFGARARTRTPRNLMFARAIATPEGRRIVAASDQHIGLGEPRLEARKAIEEFNLIEIRFDADGTGVGKVGAAVDVDYSAGANTLEVRNYTTRPARLVDVRSDRP